MKRKSKEDAEGIAAHEVAALLRAEKADRMEE